MDLPQIAIIGAGVAGLAAAWRLRDAPLKVSVFDKSRGVSGRAASRTRHGARFDFGANYFKLEDPELEQLVLQGLPRDRLVAIKPGVSTFDAAGRIQPGDPVQNRQARWTYSDGISTLGKLLADAATADIQLSTRISSLQQRRGTWMLQADAAPAIAERDYQAVVVTPPAPQAREILQASSMDNVDIRCLDQALSRARYHQQLCFVLGFAESLPRAHECFALINTDHAHDIAWLSFENDKPGRELAGNTVMMVQASPEWSRQHFEEPPESLVPVVTRSALSLLGLEYRQPDWYDCHRWRFAHPHEPADISELAVVESAGLFFAGDALVGKGRVGGSMSTGLRAAESVLSYLGVA